jgi:hypothetical protein
MVNEFRPTESRALIFEALIHVLVTPADAPDEDGVRPRKKESGGDLPRRFQLPLSAKDQNRRSTAWSACAESDSAVVESC